MNWRSWEILGLQVGWRNSEEMSPKTGLSTNDPGNEKKIIPVIDSMSKRQYLYDKIIRSSTYS